MAINATFIEVLVVAITGLFCSACLERLTQPTPALARPWRCWGLHVGVWLGSFGLLALLLGRPWFAATEALAIFLTLVLVNNAKVKTLCEPFVFQDFEYFTDTIRHPRLYIPFMGWGNFLGAATGFILAGFVGFLLEPAPAQRLLITGQLGGIITVLAAGSLLLWRSNTKPIPISRDPHRDMQTLGLVAYLWHSGMAIRALPTATSPFARMRPASGTSEYPHLVAVQSESFFDPRPLYAGIRTDILTLYDRLKQDARTHGKLTVPAWGANTVRTEFAFLCGLDDLGLGLHRFNPYRTVAAGWEVASLAAFLKHQGYRTVCIHPFPASFYRRDRVFRQFGFDEFIDIRSFAQAKKCGPYVCDGAVADQIALLLEEATSPVFVFAITMENHGPLHLERVEPLDIEELYTEPPPAGCDELTIYLRHLRNADRMVGALRSTLSCCPRPAELCWYGDHVPIMTSVYDVFGQPEDTVEYVLWSNRDATSTEHHDAQAHRLAIEWLHRAGVIVDQ